MANVVIVGGGASGLVAAIIAARNNHKVTILERNNICGKKILVTGNGRCNYYNSDQNITHYHSSSLSLSNIINENNLDRVLSFFNSIGIVPKIKDNYYYPNSNQASSIRESLILEANILGVNIVNNTYVKEIIKEDNNKFLIKTNNKNYISNKVIISTGSKAYPKTGSDGNGYSLLKSLGHNIIEPLPALVQLIGKGNYFKKWSGIRSDVSLKLLENDKLIKEEHGEIQLTDYGVSGICVMQLSRSVSLGIFNNKNEKLLINFLPWISDNKAFIEWMEYRSKTLGNRDLYGLLEGVLNNKLIKFILDKIEFNDKKWNELSEKEKNILAISIISFEVIIKETKSFDNSQVCLGGITLDEVNINTLESLKCSGLYITGEVLDVDGDCGGYNLTFAWISGIVAGSDIND